MSPTALIADAVETVTPVLCNNNCGGRCVLRAHVRNGVVVRISTDESPDALLRPQLRACLKGRSLRDRGISPEDSEARLGSLIVVGTIPAGILGLTLEHSPGRRGTASAASRSSAPSARPSPRTSPCASSCATSRRGR